jgi:threonyl-tRNA synthetase
MNMQKKCKIREHSLAKVPILMICGSKEVQDKTITLRRLGKEDQQTAKFSEILSTLSQESQAPKF